MASNVENDFSHLENGFITKRRHQNASSVTDSKSQPRFKCPLCPKYYLQFGQALSTHLVNKHYYNDLALKEFFGSFSNEDKEDTSRNYKCEFCHRQFKGKNG